MKTISISGTGYSGSGAVNDLLKEYECCKDVCGDNDEFMFAYIPDGLDDLYYHLIHSQARFQSSDIAIRRFKSIIEKLGKYGWDKKTSNKLQDNLETLCNSIVQVEWQGNWLFDLLDLYDDRFMYYKYRIARKSNSIRAQLGFKKCDPIPLRDMYLSISDESLLIKFRLFIENIICSCEGYDKQAEYIILNQAIPANNPLHYLKYFDDIKTIIVYRDPRDTFLNIQNVNRVNARWYPVDNVKHFIEYYRLMNKGILSISNEKVLVIRFEDLIYRYEDTVKKIEVFLQIQGCHNSKLSFFNPEKSIQNTQLHRYYHDFKNEINIIHEQLSDFCYDFDESLSVAHDIQF